MRTKDYEYLMARLESVKLDKPITPARKELLENNVRLLWTGYCHGAKLTEKDKKMGNVQISTWIEDHIKIEE